MNNLISKLFAMAVISSSTQHAFATEDSPTYYHTKVYGRGLKKVPYNFMVNKDKIIYFDCASEDKLDTLVSGFGLEPIAVEIDSKELSASAEAEAHPNFQTAKDFVEKLKETDKDQRVEFITNNYSVLKCEKEASSKLYADSSTETYVIAQDRNYFVPSCLGPINALGYNFDSAESVSLGSFVKTVELDCKSEVDGANKVKIVEGPETLATVCNGATERSLKITCRAIRNAIRGKEGERLSYQEISDSYEDDHHCKTEEAGGYELEYCPSVVIKQKSNVSNLAPFKFFEFAEGLELPSNRVESLDSIFQLEYLEKLDVRDNKIKTIQGINGLDLLMVLDISRNEITDLTPLKGLDLVSVKADWDEIHYKKCPRDAISEALAEKCGDMYKCLDTYELNATWWDSNAIANGRVEYKCEDGTSNQLRPVAKTTGKIACNNRYERNGGACELVLCTNGLRKGKLTKEDITGGEIITRCTNEVKIEKETICDSDYELEGDKCVKKAPTCGFGETLDPTSNRCVPLDCRDGYYRNSAGRCVPERCPTGFERIGSRCERILCDSNQELVGNRCVDIECPANATVFAGKCYCPSGFSLIGDRCVQTGCVDGPFTHCAPRDPVRITDEARLCSIRGGLWTGTRCMENVHIDPGQLPKELERRPNLWNKIKPKEELDFEKIRTIRDLRSSDFDLEDFKRQDPSSVNDFKIRTFDRERF
ncbi:EB domain-containing protein [Pseudobacteriovorax antillogorgiicola]|uniref:Leucine rich repeat-containing protein n=1 Tax=Pseudobacteriovorax antillogorgiicola TaxID=1513793 RepID=A0A1Y6C4N0_9BACT|nr:EB domain-containing protein [Pseudobacteriovorax antillogorgiicola]TCS50787.1 hypothetical protein EDD56_112170 [Pseudobacteriovorax antillogorgiicola]SMF41507.1 hypothetical protein SAMN06296036_112169 [Pseudobacteriovorax antillogorgiicola]